MDDDLFVDLHTLSATPVVVCRRLVLQQGLQSVGLSMEETTTHYDESNEILTKLKIIVPPHVCMPRLLRDIFYGDWSSTTEAAIQSACFEALLYLEKVNTVTIDCIHSGELKRCRRKLLEESSWVDAYKSHVAKSVCQEKEILQGKMPQCTNG